MKLEKKKYHTTNLHNKLCKSQHRNSKDIPTDIPTKEVTFTTTTITDSTFRTIQSLPIVLSNDSAEATYRRRKNVRKSTVAWGQRKLLLSEIQFLTLFWNPNKISNPHLLYIGAAPGHHIPLLHVLFPQFTFHLYDPRSFHLQETEGIKLHQKYFDDSDEKEWIEFSHNRQNNNLFLVSDIRTADLSIHVEPHQYEEQIWKDMQLQENWVKRIQPVRSLLKFRLPYGSGYRDPSKDSERQVLYLDGIVFTQPYTKSTSTETRLVPYQDARQKIWDVFQYENQMFRFNTIDRQIPLPLDYLSGQELLNDRDSAHEYKILKEYFETIQEYCPSHQEIQTLSQFITETLSSKKTLSKLRSLGSLAATRFLRE